MQAAILGLLALVLAGGIYWIATDSPDASSPVMEKESMMEKDAMSDEVMQKEPGDAMMKKDSPTMMEKPEAKAMMRKGSIEAYSAEKIALAESAKVVLFFHASWCPICRALDAEAAANPTLVPDGVTVLKVDYDTATALRQKYGVTVQHTFVQVDASGAAIAKWSDTSTYAQAFARIK